MNSVLQSSKLALLTIAMLAMGILGPIRAFAADSSYFCESGDPGGGGPTADIEVKAANFKITINYNRTDLEKSSRSSVFNIRGSATATTSVKEQGADCTRYTFEKPRTKKKIEFIWCEVDSFGIVNLKDFTKLNPEYELGCDEQ
jgi:hypothetical protein